MVVEKASNRSILEEANGLFPGGVNSPVRSFQAVGGNPPVFARAQGCTLQDYDGKRYLDMVQSWGAHILGHSPRQVVRAIRKQAGLMCSVGAPTREENQLASLIRLAMPSLEKLRFVSSGTEAVMSALRLARAYTGRSIIVKFDGCYHGHSDSLLVNAGSGLASAALSGSAGVLPEAIQSTVSLPYNNLPLVEEFFMNHRDKVAAVIVEPVAANMGVVLPHADFLPGLSALCDQYGSLLIFDEVITGFRVGAGGAQSLYSVTPDLTILGKIIGGGLPVGAYGGYASIMDLVAPSGPVYQAGTLSGNPLAMAAGTRVLQTLEDGKINQKITVATWELVNLLEPVIATYPDVCLQHAPGLLTLFFTKGAVNNFDDARNADTQAYARFFHAMLKDGVYLPPSQFEAWFIGAAHLPGDLKRLAKLVEKNLQVSRS